MKTHFVADGECRLRNSDSFRARERELHESICARYADQLSRAGFWRGCMVRVKMYLEFRRELRRLWPSREALYFTQRR
jgi:hypothetical protein